MDGEEAVMINEDNFRPIKISKLAKKDLEVDETFFYKNKFSAYEVMILSNLQRIANVIEMIERHMAYNNGTLEGLTRNYDPNMFRK